MTTDQAIAHYIAARDAHPYHVARREEASKQSTPAQAKPQTPTN